MNLVDIAFLSVALAIDACVVSFSYGLIFCQKRVKNSLLLAFFVGFFQFLMPVIGYFLSNSVNKFLAPISSLIVFVIFMILGIKFIIEAFQENKEKIVDCISLKCLFTVAIATSIDALGAGVSIYFSHTNILLSALSIGFVTFILSLSGFWIGNCFKKFPSKFLEITGGIILIILAFKAFIL